jgi:NAD(P)H-hydrate repair Nnr-like enzyme with NAD(P)H-hydrate epimerase domain
VNPPPSDPVRWSAEEALAMDRWLETRGFTVDQLMAVAGQRVAERARGLMAEHGLERAVLMIGPGHNGGDALVAAEHLDCPFALWHPLADEPGPKLDAETLVIDGLFGVGLCRAITGRARDAVETVNASDALVLAIDVPSGLSADTGEVVGAGTPEGGVAIHADHTITFVGPKRGFFQRRGPELVGTWTAVDIGFPVEEAEAWVRLRRVGA